MSAWVKNKGPNMYNCITIYNISPTKQTFSPNLAINPKTLLSDLQTLII